MSSTPVQQFNRSEPIPGYHTQELIGTGGYGEVWKADAPGGLVKAVKIVFGQHDQRRAARELRSLNRIKQARHPFLLSIERIEVVEGNLVVVTELADANLKQRFDQHLARGLRGIPRQELLSLLSDAADGLDYIYTQFSLQHLDVKPENLLLVGDRVKVADFGLAKNIYDRSVSLVEGLTPTYAPPEVFDGRPHRNSDQYSLAIVYQDMLTGQLPFDGTTAAQLAAQHLHGAPALSVLAKAEQPIIARALSKDADARFPSCRAFIDQLRSVQAAAESGSATVSVPTSRTNDGPSLKALQDAFADEDETILSRGATQRIDPRILLPQHETVPAQAAVPTEPLGPLHIDSDTVTYRPTIFLGVGGLATCVLRKLRRRLCDRFGSLASVPTLNMLALDTDVRALNAAMQPGGDVPLAEQETLAVPLRSPQDYRSRADRILNWLSRRWLYNIPKNLQTDGMRPLGRLALVDHAARVRQRLTEMVDGVTLEEHRLAACKESGLNFVAGPPRIYVIASVSGATGGGMFLDLAYLLRTLLAERGLSDDDVHGVLLTAASRAPQQRDKALASAYAALSELSHYSRPGSSYPGEPACRIPPFHGNNRTFSSCYLLPLGDNCNEQELETALDPIAEYLYCSSVTPGSGFFDQARQADPAAAQPFLRTFGLCQLGGSNSAIPSRIAEQLCHQLILRWRSGEEQSGPKATLSLTRPAELLAAQQKTDSRHRGIERLATEQALALGLDASRMERQVREMLRQEMGNESSAYFANVIRDTLQNAAVVDTAQRAESLMKQVVQIVDVLLAESGGTLDGASQAQFDNLYEVLLTRVEVRAGELGHALRDWLFALVENPQVRVEGAMCAGEWFRRHLRDLESKAAILAGQIKDAVFASKESLLAGKLAGLAGSARDRRDALSPQQISEMEARAQEYAQLRVEEIVHRAICKLLRSSDAHVTRSIDQLQDLWHELNRFAGRFAGDGLSNAPPSDVSVPEFVQNHWRLLQSDLSREQTQLVAHLDRIAEQQLLSPLGGLRHFLSKSADMDKELFSSLQFGARMLTVCHMRSTSGSWLLGADATKHELDLQQIRRWIEACIPALAVTNPRSRLLLVLPKSLRPLDVEARLAETVDRPVSVVYAQQSDLVACCEVESMAFAPLMAALIADNPKYAEVAERLHTRVDVEWQSAGAGLKRTFNGERGA